MSGKETRPIKSPPGGFFNEVAVRIKLVLRLMFDPRVNVFLKLLPLISLVYLFMPDLMIGPLDDAAVIGIVFTLFVELCPPQVVAEHLAALRRQSSPPEAHTQTSAAAWREDVIEGEFYDIRDTSMHNNGRKEETEKR